MEVVPTGDGEDDDGVIWFRCPQCQGFLPKLSGADLKDGVPSTGDGDQTVPGEGAASIQDEASSTPDATAEDSASPPVGDDAMAWDSPADMMAARKKDAASDAGQSDFEPPPPALAPDAKGEKTAPDPDESTHEYTAMLEAADQSDPTPYRPWGDYAVGECIHHLAWDDCGVVVAKEDLPGNRKVIKCFFEEAGVVRLIENAPR